MQKDHQTKLKLIYPVGRHLAFRSILNNMMNFVRLPSDVKNITSICLNQQKTVMAVAVRNNDVEGYEHLNLSIYFYVFGATSIVTQTAKQGIQLTQTKLSEEFRRHKHLTIRATPLQGAQALPPQETAVKDLKEGRDFSEYVQQNKLSKVNLNASGSEKVTFYDRYISKMAISKDEKFIAFILKNGLRQWYLFVYDL